MDINKLRVIGNHRADANQSLQTLMQSIKQHGFIQPIVVSKKGVNYEVVAGHRRYYAAKKLGLKVVEIVVRQVDNSSEFLAIQFIENAERENPTLEDQGKLLKEMRDEFGLSVEEIGARVSLSVPIVKATISNYTSLPKDIRVRTSAIKGRRNQTTVGKIPLGLASILSSEGRGKSKLKKKQIYEYAMKNTVSRERLKAFSRALDCGLSPAKAEKAADKVSRLTLSFICNTDKLQKAGGTKALKVAATAQLKKSGLLKMFGVMALTPTRK